MIDSVYITESEMTFVIPDLQNLFHIEKSDFYQKIGPSVKTTEFIYLGNDCHLQFIEAKKSCPNVNNREESKEKEENYERYYSDLTEKFIDSLNILAAILLKKYGRPSEAFGDGGQCISELDSLYNTRIRFILVIKTAEESWLGGCKTELERRLLSMRKIWKADVIVLNEKLAAKKGFVRIEEKSAQV